MFNITALLLISETLTPTTAKVKDYTWNIVVGVLGCMIVLFVWLLICTCLRLGKSERRFRRTSEEFSSEQED
jgi:hypothetical protein